jgi:hypothetical protein
MKDLINYSAVTRFAYILLFSLFTYTPRMWAAEAKPAAGGSWQIGTPIATYWAGPSLTDTVAEQMAEGGFNLVWCGSEKELDVARRRFISGVYIWGHHTYFLFLLFILGFRPGGFLRMTRPSLLSILLRNAKLPNGRPVRSCPRNKFASSMLNPDARYDRQSSTRASRGSTSTNRSLRPSICAAALDHRHRQGARHNFARTGFNSTYRTASIRYRSSIGKEAKRPCHKWPRQSSRKLIRRLYLRCASPIPRRRPSSDSGTTIRWTWLGIRQYAHTATPLRPHHSAIIFRYAA